MQDNKAEYCTLKFRLNRLLIIITMMLTFSACTAPPVNLRLGNMLNIPDVSQFAEMVKNGDSLMLIKSRENKQVLYLSENFAYRDSLPLKAEISVLDFFEEVYQNTYQRHPGLSPFGKMVYQGPNEGQVTKKDRIEKEKYVLFVYQDNGPGFIAYAVDKKNDIVVTLHGKNISTEILTTIN